MNTTVSIRKSHSIRTHSFVREDRIKSQFPDVLTTKINKNKLTPSFSKLNGGREVDARIKNVAPTRITSVVAARNLQKARIDIEQKKVNKENQVIVASFKENNPNCRVLPKIKIDSKGNPYRLTQIVTVNPNTNKKKVSFGPRLMLKKVG